MKYIKLFVYDIGNYFEKDKLFDGIVVVAGNVKFSKCKFKWFPIYKLKGSKIIFEDCRIGD